MKLAEHIAKHFREVYFGGNWTDSHLKGQLAGIDWIQATTPVYSLNTIAALVYHAGYFVTALKEVLEGEPLQAKDALSFDLPPIRSQADWEALLTKTWSDAETAAGLIEQLPEDKLWEPFADEKYGSYYRNLHGTIEHLHYHLGQIALIRKILLHPDQNRQQP